MDPLSAASGGSRRTATPPATFLRDPPLSQPPPHDDFGPATRHLRHLPWSWPSWVGPIVPPVAALVLKAVLEPETQAIAHLDPEPPVLVLQAPLTVIEQHHLPELCSIVLRNPPHVVPLTLVMYIPPVKLKVIPHHHLKLGRGLRAPPVQQRQRKIRPEDVRIHPLARKLVFEGVAPRCHRQPVPPQVGQGLCCFHKVVRPPLKIALNLVPRQSLSAVPPTHRPIHVKDNHVQASGVQPLDKGLTPRAVRRMPTVPSLHYGHRGRHLGNVAGRALPKIRKHSPGAAWRPV
eukprot:CAMPEP_0169452900 /NCGR_PEP_ID=MMETSP1042-20121227/14478_1 /TAXON_ID=464988 /ORGANISM="Hemiselmis andersenii, Strain CCMP1180" /LENGTH=289 /DNA_ID=CAMNT_0009564911 /DNA_START=281 /DNA_END=1148 /DNA_ORIENTATION=+